MKISISVFLSVPENLSHMLSLDKIPFPDLGFFRSPLNYESLMLGLFFFFAMNFLTNPTISQLCMSLVSRVCSFLLFPFSPFETFCNIVLGQIMSPLWKSM